MSRRMIIDGKVILLNVCIREKEKEREREREREREKEKERKRKREKEREKKETISNVPPHSRR